MEAIRKNTLIFYENSPFFAYSASRQNVYQKRCRFSAPNSVPQKWTPPPRIHTVRSSTRVTARQRHSHKKGAHLRMARAQTVADPGTLRAKQANRCCAASVRPRRRAIRARGRTPSQPVSLPQQAKARALVRTGSAKKVSRHLSCAVPPAGRIGTKLQTGSATDRPVFRTARMEDSGRSAPPSPPPRRHCLHHILGECGGLQR